MQKSGWSNGTSQEVRTNTGRVCGEATIIAHRFKSSEGGKTVGTSCLLGTRDKEGKTLRFLKVRQLDAVELLVDKCKVVEPQTLPY